MLYISTRNNLDTYTAQRALHEERTSDGGFFVPFYVPVFSPETMNYFRRKTTSETIADILNLFFSLRLNASDIENAIGKITFSCENLNQNIIIAELWHTPDGNCEYIFKQLNYLITGNQQYPVGWSKISIEISLLFALFGVLSAKSFDMAVSVDDLSSITAISYAKAMGLPVNLTICTCDDSNFLWDLLSKGECTTSNTPACLELFLHKVIGGQAVSEYIAACDKKRTYYISEEVQQLLSDSFYPAVVSCNRVENIISGIFRSNQYSLDYSAAHAYGGLQDYRAIIGLNNQTVILSKKRPERIKE